jgi:hypothetical protein
MPSRPRAWSRGRSGLIARWTAWLKSVAAVPGSVFDDELVALADLGGQVTWAVLCCAVLTDYRARPRGCGWFLRFRSTRGASSSGKLPRLSRSELEAGSSDSQPDRPAYLGRNRRGQRSYRRRGQLGVPLLLGRARFLWQQPTATLGSPAATAIDVPRCWGDKCGSRSTSVGSRPSLTERPTQQGPATGTPSPLPASNLGCPPARAG